MIKTYIIVICISLLALNIMPVQASTYTLVDTTVITENMVKTNPTDEFRVGVARISDGILYRETATCHAGKCINMSVKEFIGYTDGNVVMLTGVGGYQVVLDATNYPETLTFISNIGEDLLIEEYKLNGHP